LGFICIKYWGLKDNCKLIGQMPFGKTNISAWRKRVPAVRRTYKGVKKI